MYVSLRTAFLNINTCTTQGNRVYKQECSWQVQCYCYRSCRELRSAVVTAQLQLADERAVVWEHSRRGWELSPPLNVFYPLSVSVVCFKTTCAVRLPLDNLDRVKKLLCYNNRKDLDNHLVSMTEALVISQGRLDVRFHIRIVYPLFHENMKVVPWKYRICVRVHHPCMFT